MLLEAHSKERVTCRMSTISVFILRHHFHCEPGVADEEYIRRQLRENSEESGDSMKSLRWDGATLRKVMPHFSCSLFLPGGASFRKFPPNSARCKIGFDSGRKF